MALPKDKANSSQGNEHDDCDDAIGSEGGYGDNSVCNSNDNDDINDLMSRK